MYTISVVGCGGAGVRFLDYIPQIRDIQKIGINAENGDVVVKREELMSYENAPSSLLFERFKWLKDISGEDVFLLAGLGGYTGSTLCKIIGKHLSNKKRLWGIFVFPFYHEGSSRRKMAEESLECVKKYLNGYILMHNDSLVKHYPHLKLEIALEIPGVVAKHVIVDYIRMGMKNMLHKFMHGEMGTGVGFGVGKERIKVAIEDALSSPWIKSGEKIILISGNVERNEVQYAVKKYQPILWDLYITEEYGEQVKATVIDILQTK